MAGDVVGRQVELAAIDALLVSTSAGPTALRVRGAAGIGKSTLVRAAMAAARGAGFAVMSCRLSGSEVQMSYAALTDLLDPFAELTDDLPDPQRRAVAAATLHAGAGSRPPDLRTVAAGTLSLLDAVAGSRPLLVAIDDAHWLDGASRRAIAFAVQRCRGRVAVLWTVRDEVDSGPDGLVTSDPSRTRTLEVTGLRAAALADLVRARVARPVDRIELAHLAEVSQGNPLLALEMAQAMTRDRAGTVDVPARLGRMMIDRFRRLPPRTRETLLVCSAVAVPTLDVLDRAGAADAAAALEPAESAGVVRWDGSHLSFEHPLWREVVYGQATMPQRRAVHRVLSEVVDSIEERARHRARAAVGPDPVAVEMLDDAAFSARARGAPSAAAELLDLALGLGPTTDAALAVRAARDHLAAAEPERALSLARSVVDDPGARQHRAAALALIGALTSQVDDFSAAIPVLAQAFAEAGEDVRLRAGVALDLAFALVNSGRNQDALGWARRADADAHHTGDAGLIAETSATVTVVALINGEPIDVSGLEVLLEHEDADRPTPAVRWVVLSAGLVCLWCNDLVRARELFDRARQRCYERGIEDGLWLVLARAAEAAMLSGDVTAAHAFGAELVDWAALVGGRPAETCARAAQLCEAAWCGRLDEARRAYAALLEAAGGGQDVLVLVGRAVLGMAELSVGDPVAALAQLAPAAGLVQVLGISDPVFTPFVSDAIEAFVASGSPEQAEALVQLFRSGGERSGRRWPNGVAVRGSGILHADRGDLAAAELSFVQAVALFDSPGHRYERARTLLLLGKLLRRRRRRADARAVLGQAAELFELVGTPRWADAARDELRRLGLSRTVGDELTPSERRVAELAATGLTNAAVAARLSISPKTVEANLSRVYRKLGIRSRAELGVWVVSGRKPGGR